MKLVKLIDDNWNKEDQPEWVKNVLTVGDSLPQLNEIYEVKTTYYNQEFKYKAYELEGFEHLKLYDENAGWFKVERFELVSDEYIPNALIEMNGYSGLAMKYNFVVHMKISDYNNLLNLEIREFKKD